MGKSITNTSSLNNKNVRNNNTVVTGDIKSGNIICTNLTATNITNTELQTATSNIITLQATTSANSVNIATNQGNIATNQSSISTNSSDITDLQNNKQDTITDSTDIELNRLDINNRVFFQHNNGTGDKCSIRRANFNGRMSFTADEYYFKDENDSNIFLIINTDGSLDCRDNSIDNVLDIDLNGSSLISQLTAKQDLIIDTTDIELNDLNVNGEILFQRNNSTDSNCTINRSNNNGKMKFVGNTYAFRDSGDSQNVFLINDSGTITTVSVQADFYSSITAAELDFLDGATSNIQTQIDAKQDTITSSTSISCADINCNTNTLSGVTSLSCRSIELHNSSSLVSFLDFGGGDFRFRQLYNQSNNTFTMSIDDSTGANPENKLIIRRTEIDILNADLNLNNNNILNVDSGTFSSITLNGNDVEDSIDDKADDFAVNSNGLEMDAGAFPIRELRLLFDSTYFNINGSNELSLNKNINECKTTNFNLSSSGNWGSTSSTYPYISGWGSIATPSGSTFLSNASNGIFSVNSNGLYKIVLTVAGENSGFNGRVVLGVYLSIDDADTSFRATPGEFMLQYLRDENFGFGSSSEFTVFKTLTTSNTIRFKTRIGTNSDDRNYNDQTDDSNINIYTSFLIEKID